MDNQAQIAERLEQAATLLERMLAGVEQRQTALSGEVERISATIEQSRREEDLAGKLAAAEREIAELKAAAANQTSTASQLHLTPPPGAQAPLRKTVPASTADMLAKHGIGDAPVDVRTLDAALAGLSLEQRIAVKSQLFRAGAVS